jgi:hypothetical protein
VTTLRCGLINRPSSVIESKAPHPSRMRDPERSCPDHHDPGGATEPSLHGTQGGHWMDGLPETAGLLPVSCLGSCRAEGLDGDGTAKQRVPGAPHHAHPTSPSGGGGRLRGVVGRATTSPCRRVCRACPTSRAWRPWSPPPTRPSSFTQVAFSSQPDGSPRHPAIRSDGSTDEGLAPGGRRRSP